MIRISVCQGFSFQVIILSNFDITLFIRRVSEYQERYNELENCSATVEEACSNFTIPEDVSTPDVVDSMVRWMKF